MRDTETIKSELLAAIAARDPTALEDSVFSAFEADLPRELGDLLASVLLMPWHFRHEDVATALHRMGDARAVPALFEAALSQHAYLRHDDLFGLARKCIRALADIATPEAREHLADLTRADNAAIAAYAKKRLDALG